MLYLGYLALILISVQNLTPEERSKIEIVDADKYLPYVETHFDGGPAVGNMLNAHYFPGINLYNGGRYTRAEQEFSYVILRPQYLSANPWRDSYMSVSCYLRGMIYFYHANGFGRYSAAKEDFEAALKWNPRNYIVYIELARLYSTLGFQEQAISLVRSVLDLMPDEKIIEEARKELANLAQLSQSPKTVPDPQADPSEAESKKVRQ
jgi:tetratricopeptide (TPR) repeat protein